MLSFKARLFLFMIRHAHLFQFKLKRQPFDPSPKGIEALRKRVDNPGGLLGKMPKGVKITQQPIGDRTAEWIEPDEQHNNNVILYFHGGMYICGSPKGHRSHVAKFVKGSGSKALVIDYRLAPEHPFPAGLNDAVEAYQFLLETIDPTNIVFVGDSAGGGLCLAALLAIKDKGLSLPAGAVAISPWIDLMLSGESYARNEFKCLSPIGCASTCNKLYAGDEALDNHLVSPVYGHLKGLPSIRLYVGSDEIMTDDSRTFAKIADDSGVDVKLTIGDGLFHCYPVCAPIFPEAIEAMEEICTFIQRA